MNLKPSKVQVKVGADGAYHCTIVDLSACMGKLPCPKPLLVLLIDSCVATCEMLSATRDLEWYVLLDKACCLVRFAVSPRSCICPGSVSLYNSVVAVLKQSAVTLLLVVSRGMQLQIQKETAQL